MNRLQGKVAIVAGGGGAQGRAICERMAEEGARLVIGDVTHSALETTRDALSGHSEGAVFLSHDVTDPEQWETLVGAAEAEFGRLDVVVNAAAVLSREGVENVTVETWTRVLEVNLIGAWLGIRHSLPALRRAGGGSIVMISSIDALIGRGTAVAYHASKGGLRQMVRTAAVELASKGIRLNSVCPGVMGNNMQLVIDTGPPPTSALAKVPMGRAGTPDDIAHAVVYLSSDESSFVTGTDLVVDGGYTAQ